MDSAIETELVARARSGDDAAWESLMQAQLPAVFRLAYLILGDPDDAEDVAQEVFIRAFGALNRFDASRPLRPWLLRIARNLARNHRRSAGRYFGALQRLIGSDPDLLRNPHGAAPPLQAGREEAYALWQAIRRLSRADQEMLYLRYFLDLSEAETAGAAGVAVGTVKSRTHRALKRLRDVVEREYPSLREDLEP